MAKIDSDAPLSFPSSVRRELDYLKRDFKESINEVKKLKADRSYIVPEFESIKKEIDKMGVLVQELRGKKHECFKTEVINTMQKSIDITEKTLNNWKNVKIGAIASVLVIVAAATANYMSLRSSVENSVATSYEVKKNVVFELNSLKKELSEKNTINQEMLRKNNKEDMKEIFKEVVTELNNRDELRKNKKRQ